MFFQHPRAGPGAQPDQRYPALEDRGAAGLASSHHAVRQGRQATLVERLCTLSLPAGVRNLDGAAAPRLSLMFDSAAGDARPAPVTFDQSLYLAGSSLITLGVVNVDPTGGSRWLVLGAALAGFSVVTVAVTFILQVQSNLHQRESAVLTLSGLAGKPPSGIGLLEQFAALGLRGQLSDFFLRWRDWSAAVLHSHVSYPVLCYFHSVDTESDWLTAFQVVLDAATIIATLTEAEDCAGTAMLMHRGGSRAAAHLANAFGLDSPSVAPPDKTLVVGLTERLAIAGYNAKHADGSAVAAFAGARSDYDARLDALMLYLNAAPGSLT
jgi:hypothetical protein